MVSGALISIEQITYVILLCVAAATFGLLRDLVSVVCIKSVFKDE